MDFEPSERAQEVSAQLRDFIATRVVPAEVEAARERAESPSHQPPRVERLKLEARDRSLWNMCVRKPAYGPGLSFVDYAPLAEMMGPHPPAKQRDVTQSPTSTSTP